MLVGFDGGAVAGAFRISDRRLLFQLPRRTVWRVLCLCH